MQIINEKGPLYERIITKFPEVANAPNMLYTYGDIIYNPSGKEIPPYTVKHEEVHSRRQAEVGVEWWWQMFFDLTSFRFEEEVIAYRREYNFFCRLYKDRNKRNSFLQYLALNVSGPLYGSMVTLEEAKKQIKQ